MTTLTIGFILIAVLVGLVLVGMQIAYALISVAFVGIWVIRDKYGSGIQDAGIDRV